MSGSLDWFFLFRELPPSLLGELLTPASQLVNRRFSLQVDKWKFVGHPKAIPSFKDGEDVRVLQFNVVFILEVSGILVLVCWVWSLLVYCVHGLVPIGVS